MKKSDPDAPLPLRAVSPPGDPLAEAAQAFLAALRAEPLPDHLVALARRLQSALDQRVG